RQGPTTEIECDRRRISDAIHRLPGGLGLPEKLDLAACIIGDRKDLVEVDLRIHAVAFDNAVEPRPAIKGLGVLDALPLVDAARPAAFTPDEVLADQPLQLAKPRCDLVKVLAAFGITDVRRQLVSYGGGDHLVSSPE